MNQVNTPDLTTEMSRQIPEAARGLCWGGFFLNWIWAIGNRTWIGLLALVPFIGIVVPFVLLFKGREWAWKNGKWKSVEHFNSVQRKWTIFGIILFLITVLAVFTSIAIPTFVLYQAKAQQSEAKIALTQVLAAETVYKTEKGTFTTDLNALSLDLASKRYRVGFASTDPEFAAVCPDCVANANAFKAVAIGKIGNQGRTDVWTIDQDRQLVNVVDGTALQ